jgi:hypothetical protein
VLYEEDHIGSEDIYDNQSPSCKEALDDLDRRKPNDLNFKEK